MGMFAGKIYAREGGSWRFLPPPNTAKRIMLPNEKFALECRARYEEIGLVVDRKNGEFAHCPYPEGMGETGYYLLHDDHQHQGILQSRDVGKLCFWIGHARQWLLKCDPIPENYFELWDIYEEYSSEHGKKFHKCKDGSGKSMRAVTNGLKIHEEKNEDGKSKHAVKNGKKVHEEKNENGKSIQALENNYKLHKEKDEKGRSIHAVKMGGKGANKVHKEKDETGKSIHAVKMGKGSSAKLHSERDENGKSVYAVNWNKQIWESTEDGFRGNAGNVAKHNRKNGWDPKAKVRVEAS